MQPYWNWFSHRLLLSIINLVNSSKAKVILEKFEKKINYAMKLKVVNAKLKEKELPIPQGCYKVMAIVDNDYSEITLKEWSEIELVVSQYLDLPHPPSEINESQYIEVVWYVCAEAVDSLKSKVSQHKEDFHVKSFLFVEVDVGARKPSLSEVCN